jgi:iron complex outermembrane receptor protein
MRQFSRPGRFLCVLLTSLSAPAARCEDSPPALSTSTAAVKLDPLPVTAPPVAAPRLARPATVTTFDADFLAQNHITDFSRLAAHAPGLFASVQSPNQPSLNLRGVVSESTDPRSPERIGVYQDGLPIGRVRGSSPAFFDLESAEVWKGPQNTRFLRGAESGALALTSAPAADAKSTRITIAAGDYAARRGELVFNTPLVTEKLFFRIALLHDQNEGYVPNLAPGGEPLQGARTDALRASLRWQPRTATTFDLVYNFQNDTPPGTAFKSLEIPTTRGDTDPYSAAELNRGDILGLDRQVHRLAATLRHEISEDLTLSSTTGGQYFDSHEHYDGDGSRFNLIEPSDTSRGSLFSQELRLSYDPRERLAATAGLGGIREHGVQDVTFRTDERRLWPFLSSPFRSGLINAGVPSGLANFAVPVLNPYGPEAGLPATLPAQFAAFNNPALPARLRALAPLAGRPLSSSYSESYRNDATTSSLDLFTSADYKLTERLTVGAGARYTRSAISSGYQSYDSGAGHLGFILTGGSANNAYRPTAGRLENSGTDEALTGDVRLNYALTPAVDTYATVAQGRRPEKRTFSQSTLAAVTLQPEQLTNFETGLKTRSADGRHTAQFAVFQYYYDHFQTRQTGSTGTTTDIDAGRARGQGFETSAQTALNNHLTVFGSYGFTDAAFSALTDAGATQTYAGNSFRLAARHTLALGSTLRIPATAHGDFFLTPVYVFKSEHFFEDDNQLYGGRLRQGDFALVNLDLRYRPRRARWEAGLAVQNLLDREYLIDAGNLGGSFGIPTAIRGAPRTFAASLGVHF